jgi:hypothetical protein
MDLIGTAGPGLLAANEPQPLGFPSNASGGEIATGITYDDVANLLDISNVAWGSSFGFNDLSSTSTVAHIHGPTTSNNGNGFTQTASPLFNLTRSSSATTGGKFTDAPIALNAAQELELLNGRYYINIHTSNNGGGELRGFIVVPEPSVAGLMAFGVAGLIARRRNRTA